MQAAAISLVSSPCSTSAVTSRSRAVRPNAATTSGTISGGRASSMVTTTSPVLSVARTQRGRVQHQPQAAAGADPRLAAGCGSRRGRTGGRPRPANRRWRRARRCACPGRARPASCSAPMFICTTASSAPTMTTAGPLGESSGARRRERGQQPCPDAMSEQRRQGREEGDLVVVERPVPGAAEQRDAAPQLVAVDEQARVARRRSRSAAPSVVSAGPSLGPAAAVTWCTPAAITPLSASPVNEVGSSSPYSISPHSWSCSSRPSRSPYLRALVSSRVLGSTVARQAAGERHRPLQRGQRLDRNESRSSPPRATTSMSRRTRSTGQRSRHASHCVERQVRNGHPRVLGVTESPDGRRPRSPVGGDGMAMVRECRA